jgi:phosphate/sulfate permease
MVGVANDAVNFLNSALWSNVTSRRNILIIASIWILLWVLTSSGMMEVARKWIFNPEMFSFSNIMIIFIAVVITDVLLLDFYNTLRLPTSTTVSIVFEILWAAVAVALLHVIDLGAPLSTFFAYINRENASDIITSILLSVGISFTVGMVVQYIARFFFTYNYESKLNRWWGIFWGLALTSITYFLVIKGIKDSTLISAEQYAYINAHTWTILALLALGWTLLLQLGQMIRKRNIPKIIVLVGTFSLAAAFAGNDLVNFIWVSMAWFNSYLLYTQAWSPDPSMFMMDGLAGKVPTQFYLLFLAGAVMVATLRTSRKASWVTDTEIGLSKQQSGKERFSPSYLSRFLVRHSINVHKMYTRITPDSRRNSIDERFTQSTEEFHKQRTAPAFDLIRASVNLTVASILIAFATSMKLPLSTTYVTFMVAMGTALADGVRWRESAVYRVTGVLTVIWWWFMTAISAFLVTAIVAVIIWFGWSIAIGVLLAIVAFFLYKTHRYHRSSTAKTAREDSMLDAPHENLWTKIQNDVTHILPHINTLYESMTKHIIENKDHMLKKDAKHATELAQTSKIIKGNIHDTFLALPDAALHNGEKYVQAVDYLRKCATTIENIAHQARDYALNQHPDLIAEQQNELTHVKKACKQLIDATLQCYASATFGDLSELDSFIEKEIETIEGYKKEQLTRIKKNEVGVRNTTLYLNLLLETKNLYIYLGKILHLGRRLLGS